MLYLNYRKTVIIIIPFLPYTTCTFGKGHIGPRPLIQIGKGYVRDLKICIIFKRIVSKPTLNLDQAYVNFTASYSRMLKIQSSILLFPRKQKLGNRFIFNIEYIILRNCNIVYICDGVNSIRKRRQLGNKIVHEQRLQNFSCNLTARTKRKCFDTIRV